MPRLPGRAGLLLGAVLLAALLAEGWGLPTKTPGGSRLRSQARPAEVSAERRAARSGPSRHVRSSGLGDANGTEQRRNLCEGWAGPERAKGAGPREPPLPHKPGEQLPSCAE